MNIRILKQLKICFDQNKITFELLHKTNNFSCAEEKRAIEQSIEINETASFIIGQEIEMKRLQISDE